MLDTAIRFGVALSLFGLVAAAGARADGLRTRTVLTFSRPVEIPGQVLPAGTYTFTLSDALTDRHIVQVLSEDESRIVATVMTIPDYRLMITDAAVVTFDERPAGSADAIRAWCYPGSALGQELVYPRRRATELARASNAVVPATSVDVIGADALRRTAIIAITPDEQELPVAVAIQTTMPKTGSSGTAAGGATPDIASAPGLNLLRIASFGLAAIASGLVMLVLGRRYLAPAR